MPDYFIPRDTTPYTTLLVEMYNKDVLREFSLKYFLENKTINVDTPEFDRMMRVIVHSRD